LCCPEEKVTKGQVNKVSRRITTQHIALFFLGLLQREQC
jgi:hypothetical protein